MTLALKIIFTSIEQNQVLWWIFYAAFMSIPKTIWKIVGALIFRTLAELLKSAHSSGIWTRKVKSLRMEQSINYYNQITG